MSKINFKQFKQIDESIISILNPLIGTGDAKAPFTANDMIKALSAANLDKKPDTIKKAIKMLDVLIDYVTTLSVGKSKVTIDGIEKVKQNLQKALDAIVEK